MKERVCRGGGGGALSHSDQYHGLHTGAVCLLIGALAEICVQANAGVLITVCLLTDVHMMGMFPYFQLIKKNLKPRP